MNIQKFVGMGVFSYVLGRHLIPAKTVEYSGFCVPIIDIKRYNCIFFDINKVKYEVDDTKTFTIKNYYLYRTKPVNSS